MSEELATLSRIVNDAWMKRRRQGWPLASASVTIDMDGPGRRVTQLVIKEGETKVFFCNDSCGKSRSICCVTNESEGLQVQLSLSWEGDKIVAASAARVRRHQPCDTIHQDYATKRRRTREVSYSNGAGRY